MDATAFDPEAALAELATVGMRAVRVVGRMLEIEAAAAEVAAAWLPQPGSTPASLGEAAASDLPRLRPRRRHPPANRRQTARSPSLRVNHATDS